MKVLNFGSVNIDHVYQVDHFVRPGETLRSDGYEQFMGGKGLNQSIALANAGAHVYHAGRIGTDGLWLRDHLQTRGVDTRYLQVEDGPTGHALIQVNAAGENCIILHGGANHRVAKADIEAAIAGFSPGDYLLLQNEISSVPDIIAMGADRGLRVVFNPAPMTADVSGYPLERVGVFIMNEIEAEGLTGEIDPPRIREAMRRQYPHAITILTLGKRGAMYFHEETVYRHPAAKVTAVDTTAAGDTFIGFFLAELITSGDGRKALELGCRAAAVCVTRPGAARSIPTWAELDTL